MVRARHTTHPEVVVDCPVCGRPLPAVQVTVDARSDAAHRGGDRRVVSLEVRAQTLGASWWAAARADHPTCVPLGAGAGVSS